MSELTKNAIYERKVRIAKALDMVKAMSPVQYGKAKAVISVNLGVSDRKAAEYIQLLRAAGNVRLTRGEITFLKSGGVLRE